MGVGVPSLRCLAWPILKAVSTVHVTWKCPVEQLTPGSPLHGCRPASAIIRDLLSSEQSFVGELQFLQSHHMQYLDRCPHAPAAVTSQKAVIFRNVQDIGHFHSRWACRVGLEASPLVCVCTCMYMCACLDTDACVHTPVTCAQDTLTWMLTLAHVCTGRPGPQGSGQGLKGDRTVYDWIDPSVHHSPVQGHTCPEEHRHVCLAYPRQCLQHTYPLQPKDAGMPQKCAHISICACLHAHTLSCVGIHVHGTHTCTCTCVHVHVYTYAHRHVYMQHMCKRVWPSQPRALTFSHRSSGLGSSLFLPKPSGLGLDCGSWVGVLMSALT